ncbi:MAG TPA: DNA-3-methyladenine glycosylase [Actinomycetota bacterium]|nr:DNA-3-methyladenine glycosylase [Actinomycetota bacterium]
MPLDAKAAVPHLRRSDPVMSRIIDEVGRCRLKAGARGDHFTSLARAIVGQQLSAKAAETIWQRFLALHPDGRRVLPADVLAIPDADMRAVGMSGAKTASVKDLAARVESGELRLDRISRLPDDKVIEALVPVRGIGRWTAEMFLLFKLGRPDVWPVDDLGIRNALKRHYGLAPTSSEMRDVAEPWRPYRSVASWYLWRSLDVDPLSSPATPSSSRTNA